MDRDDGCRCRRKDLEFDADCRNTFWVEAPLCLLTQFSLVPGQHMSLEEKMNTVTRIVLIVFVIMLFMRYKHALTFLAIALVLIILIYYAKKRAINGCACGLSRRPVKESTGERQKKTGKRRFEEDDVSHAGESDLDDDDSSEHGRRRWVTAGEGRPLATAEPSQKKNPRRPYPPTVPVDMIIKASKPEDPKYGKVLNTDPGLAPYVKPFGGNRGKQYQPSRENTRARAAMEESSAPGFMDKNDDEYEAERQMNLRNSYLGPRVNYSKYHGYKTENFQDDEPIYPAEESDDELDIEQEVIPVSEAPPVTVAPRRRFYPANYDPVAEPELDPNPVGKLTAHGATRGVRRAPNWADQNKIGKRIDPADIMFARSGQLEKQVKARSRTDRESHLNSF